MKPYKRPEKETDPAKYPGQIVNPIPNFEKPLEKSIEEYHQLCPTCQGNDRDAPCAYPEGGRKGCLRDARLAIDPRFAAAHYLDGRDLK